MRRLQSHVTRGLFALLLACAALLTSVRDLSAAEYHVVRPGETLSQIAVRYGTTVDRLRRLNNLANVHHVWYGQRLRVNAGASGGNVAQGTSSPRYYTVRYGDSLTNLALRYGVSVAHLARMNNISPTRWLYRGQVLLLPGAPGQGPAAQTGSGAAARDRFYTVRPGDSLTILAQRYGISVARLMSMNGMGALRWLYVGQVIRVPGLPGVPGVPGATGQPNASAPVASLPHSMAHTVQTGESLSAIGHRYGVDPSVLMRVNGISNGSLLAVGQTLRIPSHEALELIAQLYPRLDNVRYPTYTERWVEVDLSAQLAVAYEGGIPVRSFVISTGVGNTPTVTGTFRIWAKVEKQDMQGGNLAAGNYYYLRDVQNVQYFFKSYAFHGTYWHNNFGRPMSRGCVNMTEDDAAWLFQWTSPAVYTSDWLFSTRGNPGTLVMVHW